MLDSSLKSHYDEHGFAVVGGAFSEPELERMSAAVLRAVREPDTSVDGVQYPAPGKQFTLRSDRDWLTDPDLRSYAVHPVVLEAVETMLSGPAVLGAFVAYLKTPGAAGTRGDYEAANTTTAHCDVKTYVQASSSLDWLLAIAPMVDLDETTGPLWLIPGSHKLSHIEDAEAGVKRIVRAPGAQLGAPVDSKLTRGDLCLMHGATWHEGGSNRSDHDRFGFYCKYLAADAPPGAGPDLMSERVFAAMPDGHKDLLPYHDDRPIVRTRLLMVHDDHVLLVGDGNGGWTLPGGPICDEDRKRFYDKGVVIESLDRALTSDLGLDLDWLTYIGDFREDEGLCRVYARPVDVRPKMRGDVQVQWAAGEQLASGQAKPALGFEADALRAWQQPGMRRAIGQSKRRAAPGRGE